MAIHNVSSNQEAVRGVVPKLLTSGVTMGSLVMSFACGTVPEESSVAGETAVTTTSEDRALTGNGAEIHRILFQNPQNGAFRDEITGQSIPVTGPLPTPVTGFDGTSGGAAHFNRQQHLTASSAAHGPHLTISVWGAECSHRIEHNHLQGAWGQWKHHRLYSLAGQWPASILRKRSPTR